MRKTKLSEKIIAVVFLIFVVSTLPAQENGGSADELLSPLEITVEG